MADYRAPANDGEVLAVPDFAAVPGLVISTPLALSSSPATSPSCRTPASG
ncbi:MAG TPA: hypothetical protein VM529_06275 [Gemmata sp.]|nr:hypothetical protein [Gemmata sp.]